MNSLIHIGKDQISGCTWSLIRLWIWGKCEFCWHVPVSVLDFSHDHSIKFTRMSNPKQERVLRPCFNKTENILEYSMISVYSSKRTMIGQRHVTPHFVTSKNAFSLHLQCQTWMLRQEVQVLDSAPGTLPQGFKVKFQTVQHRRSSCKKFPTAVRCNHMPGEARKYQRSGKNWDTKMDEIWRFDDIWWPKVTVWSSNCTATCFCSLNSRDSRPNALVRR